MNEPMVRMVRAVCLSCGIELLADGTHRMRVSNDVGLIGDPVPARWLEMQMRDPRHNSHGTTSGPCGPLQIEIESA